MMRTNYDEYGLLPIIVCREDEEGENFQIGARNNLDEWRRML